MIKIKKYRVDKNMLLDENERSPFFTQLQIKERTFQVVKSSDLNELLDEFENKWKFLSGKIKTHFKFDYQIKPEEVEELKDDWKELRDELK